MNQKKTNFYKLTNKFGVLFESKISLGHYISSNFKMSAGVARSCKRNFAYSFPERNKSPPFVQQLDARFIHYLVTKKRFFKSQHLIV